MKLEDIPALRAQFEKIDTDKKDKIRRLPSIPMTGDIEYAKYKRGGAVHKIDIEADKERQDLCEKIFGSKLCGYEWDVYPDDVLDWIEHFLQVDHVPS